MWAPTKTRRRQTWTSWSAAKFLCHAGLGFKQRRQRKLKELSARKVLVLPASEFEHLFKAGLTEMAYAVTPVSGLTQHDQGRICHEWARMVLQQPNPDTQMFDPEPQTYCNGRKGGSHQAAYDYDFIVGGRRVEIKGWSGMSGSHVSSLLTKGV